MRRLTWDGKLGARFDAEMVGRMSDASSRVEGWNWGEKVRWMAGWLAGWLAG